MSTSSEEENLQRQQEEIEALNAIYDENMILDSESSFTIIISSEDGNTAKLFVSFNPTYPSTSPPTYQLSAPFLSSTEKYKISAELDQLYLDNIGDSIVFLWAEQLRTFLQNRADFIIEEDEDKGDKTSISKESLIEESLQKSKLVNCPEIVTGDIIEDRKSVFQGHTATVKSLDEVKLVISRLYENKKIAQATHNIYAYRIYCEDKQTWLSDCEDDGEDAAGGRLLHLLDILDIVDRVVVVSRWYGGALLGPDRFKHINNAARIVLSLADPTKLQDDNKAKKKKGK